MTTCFTSQRLFYSTAILAALGCAFAFTPTPLYGPPYNAQFLHGLAHGEYGFLSHDWQAGTTDPVPLFSLLVATTYRYLPDACFYLYSFLILGMYFWGIAGIASATYDIHRSSRVYFAFFVVIAGLHSAALGYLSSYLTGINLSRLFYGGLGHQCILGTAFQPATFGVFLCLSLYAFLRDRFVWAVVCAGLAAAFCPAYLLSAAMLMLAYIFVLLAYDKRVGTSILLGLLGVSLLAPVLYYSASSFGTTSPEIVARARGILVDFRIPHRAKPSEWFDGRCVMQIAVVGIALIVTRNKRVFPLLLVPCLVGGALTILQVVTGDQLLALLFPWRISAVLVPVSSCLIVAAVVSLADQAFDKRLSRHPTAVRLVLAAVAVLIILSGAFGMRYKRAKFFQREEIGLMKFVAASREAGDVYLVPTELEGFRVFTGAPIVVDEDLFPYQDVEVLEWFDRLQTAKEFYALQGAAAEDHLQDMVTRYGVTHVVARTDRPAHHGTNLREVFRDDHFLVYEMPFHE